MFKLLSSFRGSYYRIRYCHDFLLTTCISVVRSKMTLPDPLRLLQPYKANMRGCLGSYLDHFPREMIRREFAKLVVTLRSSLTR